MLGRVCYPKRVVIVIKTPKLVSDILFRALSEMKYAALVAGLIDSVNSWSNVNAIRDRKQFIPTAIISVQIWFSLHKYKFINETFAILVWLSENCYYHNWSYVTEQNRVTLVLLNVQTYKIAYARLYAVVLSINSRMRYAYYLHYWNREIQLNSSKGLWLLQKACVWCLNRFR